MRSTPVLVLALAGLVGCAAPPRTSFELVGDPPEAAYRASWGPEGSLPATLEPPVRVGRQWVDVFCPGFHTQRLRFEYLDRRAVDTFADRKQRLFGLEEELADRRAKSDLDRDLSLDFDRVTVRLVPSDEPPIFVVDLAVGTDTGRVDVER